MLLLLLLSPVVVIIIFINEFLSWVRLEHSHTAIVTLYRPRCFKFRPGFDAPELFMIFKLPDIINLQRVQNYIPLCRS